MPSGLRKAMGTPCSPIRGFSPSDARPWAFASWSAASAEARAQDYTLHNPLISKRRALFCDG